MVAGEVTNPFFISNLAPKTSHKLQKSAPNHSKLIGGSGDLESMEYDKITYKKMVLGKVVNHFFK